MSNTAKTIAVTTLGCKVNQCDSAAISQQLQQEGYSLIPFNRKADCYIINTCAVTASTEAQSRQMIRRALRRSEKALIVVTGCYAQKNAELLRTISPRVHIAGNAEKKAVPCMVDRLFSGDVPFLDIQDISQQLVFTTPGAENFIGRTRAFLKIQDGCNSRCAYCIVPSVRGPSRSLPAGQVIRRMHALVKKGYREIVFTGIHLGAWGSDLKPISSLGELLRLCQDEAVFEGIRLRLSSIEPTEWSDTIINLMARTKNICPHVHIPLQSGDAAILKSMRRPYTPEFFYGLVMRLVREIPGINIGIDVIAGFPGETDECFNNTCSLLESLPAGYLHAFPYSLRPGTPASRMSDQVPAVIKRKRMNVLRQLSERMKKQFYERWLGAEMEVLVESARDKETGLLRGITRNYIAVLFNGDDTFVGTLRQVRLTAVHGTDVMGCLV